MILKETDVTCDASELVDWVDAYKRNQEAIEELKRKQEIITNKIKSFMREHKATVGTVDGVAILSYRTHQVSRIGTKLLRQHYPEIADMVTRTVPESRLLLTDERKAA